MESLDNQIIVSIQCLSYNHAPYIRQCLDGFVMQKTNFRFEAIVHDDASTDGTQDIIREYEKKYPDIIKPIYQKENQYSKGISGYITNLVTQKSKGKYIALCEGDDYWTDPLKLQKQVDYLEANPDYSMCFHNAIVHWEQDGQADSLFSHPEDREYSGVEIFKNWIVPTASVVFKRTVYESSIYKKTNSDTAFCYGDILIFLSCCACGKVYGMSDVMSVYRRHEGSAVFDYSIERQIKQAYHSLEIYKVFGDEYKVLSKDKFFHHGMEAFLNAKAEGEISYKLLFDLIIYTPAKTFGYIFS